MFTRSLPLAIAALLLAGCQSNASNPDAPTLTPAQEKEQAAQRAVFEKRISYVLAREGNLANIKGRRGSFNLLITFDDKNRVIGCNTESNRKFDSHTYPYNAKLAKDLVSICWASVLPELPSSLIDLKERTAHVVAPIGVSPLTGLSAEQRLSRAEMLERKAQNNFLYQQLLAPLPVDSIGVATLIVMTDSTGHVQECAASLDPHTLRSAEFKQDEALLSALITRCKATDISAMPGFTPNPAGTTSLLQRIEYTPWKAGLKAK